MKRISYGGAMIGWKEVFVVLKTILSHGGKRWTLGTQSELFEKELAEVAGTNHAVVTNSGSSALLLAIAALKLPPKSRIIIPAVNFPTAFNAIIQNGHIPVVVDVDLSSLNLSLDEVRKAIKKYPRIKAVIAVHIAGNPVGLDELRMIVGDKRKIILDNCDGFGTTINGKMVEQYADVSCASFHAAHIITTGEGGAVFTDDKEIADRVKKLRDWGRADGTDEFYLYTGFPQDYRKRYVYEEIGYNLKPLELQCAMGRVQLKKLQKFKEKRRQNFQYLHDLIRAFGYKKHYIIKELDAAETCWFSFPLLVDDRKEVTEFLEKNGVETRTIFSGNITKHPAYKDTKYIKVGTLENADYVMGHGFFVSVHPSLGKRHMNKIIIELYKVR